MSWTPSERQFAANYETEPEAWVENNYHHWRAAGESAVRTLEMAEKNVGRLSLQLMGQLPLFEDGAV